MQKLIELIKEKTLEENREDFIETITNMVTTEESYIPLEEQDLIDALSIKGEFLVLRMKYEDFEDELKYEKIKYKISQSLSVVVSYEEDGKSFSEIEKFVHYIRSISDSKQNSIFGIKKVEQLSEFPITILFSGILPINQLKMSLGKKLYEHIKNNPEYFKTKFKSFRDELSQEIGIPILPVFPYLDETLNDTEVTLVDLLDGRLISRFETLEKIDKDLIDGYLQRLFYVYKVLAQEKETENMV